MKVSMIQMNSQPDRTSNLAQAIRVMEQAVRHDRPDLIVLPEHFDWSGGTPEQKLLAADDLPGGKAYRTISAFAAKHQVWVHAGSMLERVPGDTRIFNTTVVFDGFGNEVGRYRKIHLFDITTPSGRRYGESDTVMPGSNLMVYEMHGLRIGCAICYDLRFSNLFWELAQREVDVMMLPAAFTSETGRDHWEVLCRARAIEFQCYFVACGQWGAYPSADGSERSCFGNSLICDPWGRVITRSPEGVGYASTELKREAIEQSRKLIPMAAHRKRLSSCGSCQRIEGDFPTT
jgi:predicted amidohydrolase